MCIGLAHFSINSIGCIGVCFFEPFLITYIKASWNSKIWCKLWSFVCDWCLPKVLICVIEIINPVEWNDRPLWNEQKTISKWHEYHCLFKMSPHAYILTLNLWYPNAKQWNGAAKLNIAIAPPNFALPCHTKSIWQRQFSIMCNAFCGESQKYSMHALRNEISGL